MDKPNFVKLSSLKNKIQIFFTYTGIQSISPNIPLFSHESRRTQCPKLSQEPSIRRKIPHIERDKE
jgi:hypothetical protein